MDQAALHEFELFENGGLAYIQKLLSEKASESEVLDFKRASRDTVPFVDDDRKELAEMLSAFSNTFGGVIAWGVECRKKDGGPDVVQELRPIQKLKEARIALEAMAAEVVKPAITGIRYLTIADDRDADSGFIVMLVPRCNDVLREANAKGMHGKHFFRAGATCQTMTSVMIHKWYEERSHQQSQKSGEEQLRIVVYPLPDDSSEITSVQTHLSAANWSPLFDLLVDQKAGRKLECQLCLDIPQWCRLKDAYASAINSHDYDEPTKRQLRQDLDRRTHRIDSLGKTVMWIASSLWNTFDEDDISHILNRYASLYVNRILASSEGFPAVLTQPNELAAFTFGLEKIDLLKFEFTDSAQTTISAFLPVSLLIQIDAVRDLMDNFDKAFFSRDQTQDDLKAKMVNVFRLPNDFAALLGPDAPVLWTRYVLPQALVSYPDPIGKVFLFWQNIERFGPG